MSRVQLWPAQLHGDTDPQGPAHPIWQVAWPRQPHLPQSPAVGSLRRCVCGVESWEPTDPFLAGSPGPPTSIQQDFTTYCLI